MWCLSHSRVKRYSAAWDDAGSCTGVSPVELPSRVKMQPSVRCSFTAFLCVCSGHFHACIKSQVPQGGFAVAGCVLRTAALHKLQAGLCIHPPCQPALLPFQLLPIYDYDLLRNPDPNTDVFGYSHCFICISMEYSKFHKGQATTEQEMKSAALCPLQDIR